MSRSAPALTGLLAMVILSCSTKDDDDDELDSSSFAQQYAEAYCDFLEECGDLPSDTGMSKDECVEHYQTSIESIGTTCAFDVKNAEECLRALDAATCGEAPDQDACKVTYDCSSDSVI